MNIQNIRAVDHARAAAVVMAVATDDDDMAALAIQEASKDPYGDAVTNLIVASAVSLVQMLQATMGQERAEDLLRRTLAQLRATAEEEGS